MDYCGVEYTAIESAGGSSWQWRILIVKKDKVRTSGEAVWSSGGYQSGS
jgi:hypothetical protein